MEIRCEFDNKISFIHARTRYAQYCLGRSHCHASFYCNFHHMSGLMILLRNTIPIVIIIRRCSTILINHNRAQSS